MTGEKNTIAYRMVRFSFEPVDSNSQTWEKYISHFEQARYMRGLVNYDNESNAMRREILLAYVRAKYFRTIVPAKGKRFHSWNGTIIRQYGETITKPVEAEVQRLVKEGMSESVDPAATPLKWATPVVCIDKRNGNVRICGNFRATINPNLLPESHLLPIFEELTTKLVSGQEFSTIDLKDAFLQMLVDEKSQKYLTTHIGYFQYKKLPFGITAAPAIYKRYMESLLATVANAGIYLDDVIITGENKSEHLENLRNVFQKLRKAGLKTHKNKCNLFKKSVTCLKHRIDGDGIHPTMERVEAIAETTSPKNVKERRTFLGAVNFLEKFIPQLHGTCARLHQLTGAKKILKWSEKEEQDFKKIKELVTQKSSLVPYDPKVPLVFTCDASERGLGAGLFERFLDGTEKPIAFAPQTPSGAKNVYAPIDREALALLFSVRKFHQYVYGRQFLLMTDHRPLDYKIEYRKGKQNYCADALSRLPMQTEEPYTVVNREIKRINMTKLDDLWLSEKEKFEEEHKKRIKPDLNTKRDIEIWKQKMYQDWKSKSREFRIIGEEVCVKNELNRGWSPGITDHQKGKLSYEVLVAGKRKRKHADQHRKQNGALDDTLNEENLRRSSRKRYTPKNGKTAEYSQLKKRESEKEDVAYVLNLKTLQYEVVERNDICTLVEVCQSNEQCLNKGVCVLLQSGNVCECDDQFFGTNCELKIGSCEKALCQNDAACLQVTNNAYKCDCSYKYEGTFCEKKLSTVEIYIRLITNSLAFQMALIIIVLIIIVFGCFLLIMAIRGHHIRKETSFERVLRTGLEKRKAVIAQYDAKHKLGNEKGTTQKSSSSAVG
ncbi:Retrovirus-related Pol polyprotein from transposon [Trichinella spiralis]|uniref:RNA-directed DNA polymerase n=2 Tax=Trichinella spiralis TaxID=6334 RepID=A0A0V1AXV3_TRISP|nr:Retrovirus-related Pol polyprotein from transposon [Trichinella spiralis]